ncbi:MAG: TonB-dependent receptor plug domain-containing protein [Gammaproteobacteria bacterium]|nr:TonB-dependent receptor plug domain-containing protein [Gammaproteobacteria bacterium]
MYSRFVLRFVLAVLAGMASLSLPAQDADTSREVLEEVTTVARKIEERLIEVPLAITNFSTEEIERAGIRDLNDVAAFTPSLTFSNVIGEFLPVPVIRNMAPTAIFQENNAGVFVDGVFVSGREGLNFSQLDVASIDVVKGPVSALYGRSTFSGAILYTTARPTDEFSGKAEVQYGSDGKELAKVSLSGPIAGDWLKGRAAVLYDNWDGSYPNQSGGERLGGYEYKTFTGSLLFTAGDSFEALLGLYASDDQIGTSALTSLPTNCENRALVNPMSSGLANFCGELPTADDDMFSTIVPATGEDRDLVRAHLNMTWDLAGGASISSISGYSSLQQSFFEDASRSGGATFAYQATPFAPARRVSCAPSRPGCCRSARATRPRSSARSCASRHPRTSRCASRWAATTTRPRAKRPATVSPPRGRCRQTLPASARACARARPPASHWASPTPSTARGSPAPQATPSPPPWCATKRKRCPASATWKRTSPTSSAVESRHATRKKRKP